MHTPGPVIVGRHRSVRRVLTCGVAGLIVLGGLVSCSSGDDSSRTSTEPTTGLASAGQFCQLARDARDAGLAIDTSVTDRAVLEPLVDAALVATRAAAEVAPDDYADIAAATIEQQEGVHDLLDRYDYDFAAAIASDEGQAFFTAPELAELKTERDAYLQERCDLAPAAAANAGVTLSPGDDGIRQLFQLLQIGGQLPLTDEQIDCLVDDLSGRISDADVQAIGGGGAVSEAGTAALTDAIDACGVVVPTG